MSFDPVYTDLQSDPDNIEVIRDQIAALLFLDLQKRLLLKLSRRSSKLNSQESSLLPTCFPVTFLE